MLEKNNTLRIIAGLSTCTFGGAQAIMIALYPAIALSLKIDLTTVIYCASAGTFLFLFGSPYWSNTTAYLSRSTVMLIGTGGLLASFALVTFLVNYSFTSHTIIIYLFLLSQIFYGLIASGTVPAAQTLQTHLVDASHSVRASFIHTMSLNIGRIIGYTLIVFFYENYTHILLIYSWLIMVVLLMQFSQYKNDKVYSAPTKQQNSWHKEAKDIRWIIMMALLYTCYLETLVFSLADTIKKQFHLDILFASGFSAKILLLLSIGIFVGQYIGKQFFKESWRSGMIMGITALLFGAILLIHAETLVMLWIAIGNIVIGLGLLPALYLSLLRTEQANQSYGKRAGIIAAAHTVGYTSGGILAGYACTTTALSIGYYLAAITLCLGFSLYKHITSSQYNKRSYEYSTETH